MLNHKIRILKYCIIIGGVKRNLIYKRKKDKEERGKKKDHLIMSNNESKIEFLLETYICLIVNKGKLICRFVNKGGNFLLDPSYKGVIHD